MRPAGGSALPLWHVDLAYLERMQRKDRRRDPGTHGASHLRACQNVRRAKGLRLEAYEAVKVPPLDANTPSRRRSPGVPSADSRHPPDRTGGSAGGTDARVPAGVVRKRRAVRLSRGPRLVPQPSPASLDTRAGGGAGDPSSVAGPSAPVRLKAPIRRTAASLSLGSDRGER
jgi:hypothetical protein